jgi:aerobic carbon-monoxide dehydrogenase large subunit
MSDRFVGTSVERREDQALLTGRGRFTDDIALPGTLVARMVRSPHPHARIVGIDAGEARRAPGVHAVITAADLPEALRQRRFPLLVPNPWLRRPWTCPVLAVDEACYVGEPVAVVVADDRARARDAEEKVHIDWEVLPSAGDCLGALEPGAPPVHTGDEDNLAAVFTVGHDDVDAAIAAAPHRLTERIWQHRGAAHSMEGRAVLAVHDPIDDQLTVWSACQAPYGNKQIIGQMLDRDDTGVRVVAPDVGGGFGPKGIVYPEDVLIPWLALHLGRPVRWTEDRQEQSIATTQERDEHAEATVAFDDDGRIRAVDVRVVHDTGAFVPWGIITPIIGATTLPGPYVLPAYRLQMRVALTNKVACSPLRGTGRPQAVFVMERLVDRIAQALGLDRAEVRERNMIRPGQLPYDIGLTGRDGSPVIYDSGDYPACQALALERADYASFGERQATARQQGRYLGIGIANLVEATGLGPHEGAEARILSTGRLGIFTGAASQGQSHQTVLAQVAADAFGTTPDQVDVITADTARFPAGVGTFASRIAVNAGSSVHQAACRLREQVLELAASLTKVPADQIALVPGAVHVEGHPDIPLSELRRISLGMPGFTAGHHAQPGLSATEYFRPAQSTYSNATHVVEVEVDPETGRVDFVRYVVGHDCGRALNPMIVDGQIQGGVAHGIGNALYEFCGYDERGYPLTTTLEEYLLPAVLDVPKVEIVSMESPTPLNPLGVKGAGEAGTIPAAAAIISAIENALAPFGVRIQRAPVTAEHLAELVLAAGGGRR